MHVLRKHGTPKVLRPTNYWGGICVYTQIYNHFYVYLQPDVILQDMIKAVRPTLQTEHKFVSFYALDYACIYIYMCVCVCMYIYIHICSVPLTYTHINTFYRFSLVTCKMSLLATSIHAHSNRHILTYTHTAHVCLRNIQKHTHTHCSGFLA